ncbi:MAG: nucleoside kinase [Clostridia bacterium]|nr:nucleoside kinase [Clostridia bacterium]
MANYDVKAINRLLNEDCEKYIMDCENAYRRQLDEIVCEFIGEKGRSLLMLAGPSSSGKTTTARLLKEKLIEKGRNATVISLDDFYLVQDEPHTFEDGTVDFERAEALDLPLISECLHELMDKGESEIPRFCFKSKVRSCFEKVTVSDDEVIIVEGLHAINPVITQPLSDEKMRLYYVSVSSRITDGDEVLLSKRDLRLIRRLIRDYHHRNSDVDYTFYLWKAVRMGEDRYLFPFSSRAERKIDSIHPYEVAFFRNIGIKLLDRVASDSVYYDTAKQLRQKLERFVSVERDMLPHNSLLEEFI